GAALSPYTTLFRSSGLRRHENVLPVADAFGAQAGPVQEAFERPLRLDAVIRTGCVEAVHDRLGEDQIDAGLLAEFGEPLAQWDRVHIQLDALGARIHGKERQQNYRRNEVPHTAQDLDLPSDRQGGKITPNGSSIN